MAAQLQFAGADTEGKWTEEGAGAAAVEEERLGAAGKRLADASGEDDESRTTSG